MEKLSYRTHEVVLTPEERRELEAEERRRQREFDIRQGMRMGVGPQQPKLDRGVHNIKSDAERDEEKREEREEQDRHDFAAGANMNLRRIGWA